MLDTRIGGVEFWAINTDAQALGRSKAKGASILNIGSSVTRGLGAGGDPEMGRLAAEESRAEHPVTRANQLTDEELLAELSYRFRNYKNRFLAE